MRVVGSTVNTCAQNLSKAFDKKIRGVFVKLMDIETLLLLLGKCFPLELLALNGLLFPDLLV